MSWSLSHQSWNSGWNENSYVGSKVVVHITVDTTFYKILNTSCDKLLCVWSINPRDLI